MSKIRLPKSNSFITLLLLSILFFECKSKENTKDISFQSIENYFSKKGWNFPINIQNTALLVKYYRDTSKLNIVPSKFANDIKKIKNCFNNKKYLNLILEKTLLDTTKIQASGYFLSNPIIFIDTTDFGNINIPKLFLAFSLTKYRINKDSASHGIPCEDCILEEGNKILRYPSAVFFKLNSTKDGLILSRVD